MQNPIKDNVSPARLSDQTIWDAMVASDLRLFLRIVSCGPISGLGLYAVSDHSALVRLQGLGVVMVRGDKGSEVALLTDLGAQMMQRLP